MYTHSWARCWLNCLWEVYTLLACADLVVRTLAKEVYVSKKETTEKDDVDVRFENTTVTMVTSYQLPQIDSNMTENALYSHKTAIIVIMSIFVSITLTITVAILMFCKKKNSVFVLQKCEQESESVYEMDDINTECDFSDQELDINSYNENLEALRSQTYPKMSRLCEYELDSPLPGRTRRSNSKQELNSSSRSSIPKSKTFAGLRKSRTLRESDIMFAPNKHRMFSRSDVKRPTSLPLSSSFSSSGSWYNYQSMVITADVEPWENSESEVCFPPTAKNDINSIGISLNQLDRSDSNCVKTSQASPYSEFPHQLMCKKSNFSSESFNEKDEDTHAYTPLLQGNNRGSDTPDVFTFPHSPKQVHTPLVSSPEQDNMCYKPLLEPDSSTNLSLEKDFQTNLKKKIKQISPKQFLSSNSPASAVQSFINKGIKSNPFNQEASAPGQDRPKHQGQTSPGDNIQGRLHFYWDTDS